MSYEKLYFVGLLANVDSSILKVRLEHGFRVEALGTDEGTKLLSDFEGHRDTIFLGEFSTTIPCFNNLENKYYIVTNTLESEDEVGNHDEYISKWTEFTRKCGSDYLDRLFQVMRLFKQGNICMPRIYFYILRDSIPRVTERRFPMYRHVSRELYTLEDSEMPAFESFIQNIRLPFSNKNLQLAFDNFELSYHILERRLSFLSLMTSLEALFNSGDHEIGYTISRNTAIVVGINKDDTIAKFLRMKQLYKKRSKIIHQGKDDVTRNEVGELRYYVRESIKTINVLGMEKQNVLNFLTSLGFNEKPWLK